MDTLLFELRLAVRGLVRNRGLTLSAALALALGIGATTTLFSIVHGGLADLPFDQSEELVLITRAGPAQPNRGAQPFDYFNWSSNLRSFEGVAAFEAQAMNLAGPEQSPERVSSARITPNTFDLLGARPALGRAFQPVDAVPGAPATALIGHALWQARFSGDPDIVGRVVRVDGQPHTIIGVMPADFGFPVNQSMWLPLQLSPSSAPGEGNWLTVFGRLRDGAALEQSRGEVNTLAARLSAEFPATHGNQTIRLAPIVEMEMDPSSAPILTIMLLVVSFVLVIACANVANLLLARAARRSRETAIRTVLGAARSRIIAQHLLEALLIALVGGAGGLAIAFVGVRFFELASANILEAFWIQFKVDRTVLIFAGALVGMAGILAGLLPALRSSQVRIAGALKESAASGLRIGRISRALIVVELTLASGLLVVSGLLVQAAVGLRAVEFPFAATEIYTAQLGMRAEQLADPADRARLLRAVTDEIGAIPGVRAAALATVLPGRGAGSAIFSIDGQSFDRPQDMPFSGLVLTTPGFLDVLDGRVLRGRGMQWSDDVSAARVAWVNESWVRRFSPDRDPLGRTIAFPRESPATIVGVLSDMHVQDPGDPRGDAVYMSMQQARPWLVRVMARSNGDVLSLTPPVRAGIQRVDPDLPIFEIATLRDAIYADKRVLDAFGTLFALFGVSALFLTTIGLYGVVAFSVARRTREFGIRMSLGATSRSILILVIRSTMRPLVLGSVLGLLLGAIISIALAATAGDFFRPDARVFVAVFAALGVTAATALVVPAQRAARLDPQHALRSDSDL